LIVKEQIRKRKNRNEFSGEHKELQITSLSEVSYDSPCVNN